MQFSGSKRPCFAPAGYTGGNHLFPVTRPPALGRAGKPQWTDPPPLFARSGLVLSAYAYQEASSLVLAEYERAKIAERYRRGKLWRSRAGEVIAWKCAYGYRRIARCADRAAHLEVYEPEAAIVRSIFRDYVEGNLSMRRKRQLIDTLPARERRVEYGRHGRFGEHDVC